MGCVKRTWPPIWLRALPTEPTNWISATSAPSWPWTRRLPAEDQLTNARPVFRTSQSAVGHRHGSQSTNEWLLAGDQRSFRFLQDLSEVEFFNFSTSRHLSYFCTRCLIIVACQTVQSLSYVSYYRSQSTQTN